jgi:hypothetical protein
MESCSSSAHLYGQLSEVIIASTSNRTSGKFLNRELLIEDLSLVVYLGECKDQTMRDKLPDARMQTCLSALEEPIFFGAYASSDSSASVIFPLCL